MIKRLPISYSLSAGNARSKGRQIQLTVDADTHLAAFYQSQEPHPLSDFGCIGYAK